MEKIVDSIILDLAGKTKEEVLLNIVKFAKQEKLIQDEQLVYSKFLQREQLGTTAIGKGIALPEACWTEMSKPYVFILCRTKELVDFNSLDGKPVRIILVSLGRDKADLTRLKPMARLAKLLKSKEFRNNFLKVRSIDKAQLLLNR
ncbi:MAG TPA: PTS sugar transporter subunit IIA [Candidatus Wunengus sp. YC60]|uniref:PTS sugar transporter subunit IIA n=1 Tax=Candidatus Wunengus sp. YC60 TaxID=3367697 RepID=UPI004024E2BD